MYLGPRTPPPPEGGHGIQYIFFDSEGINGSKTPMMSKKFIKDLFYQTKLYFFGYAKSSNLSNDNSEETNQEKAMKEARMKHVQASYPKLLYLFGDVLLFVTSHDWREKGNMKDTILTWARSAGGGAIDHGVKPKLIVIFNKVTAVNRA
jgi:hypothetical protein